MPAHDPDSEFKILEHFLRLNKPNSLESPRPTPSSDVQKPVPQQSDETSSETDENEWRGELREGSYGNGLIYYLGGTEIGEFRDGVVRGNGYFCSDADSFNYTPGNLRSFVAAAQELVDLVWYREHDDD